MDQDTNRDEPKGDFVPRAPRFKVDDSSEAIVRLTRATSVDHEPISAALMDVSQHGVKLRVPVNLQFEEALQIELEVRGTDLCYQGVASVRHIRSADDENWVVGCAIAPAISDETFSYLATTSGKERRQFRRLPIAAHATVRRQAQADGCEVGLHNLSSGGICFTSPVQFEIGERVQLYLEDKNNEARVIEARIRWQVDGPEGNIVGCQFSSRSSYAELCSCLNELPSQQNSDQEKEKPTSQLVLVAAVLAMFVPPLLTVMLQSNSVSAVTLSGSKENDLLAESLEKCMKQKPETHESSNAAVNADLIAALKSAALKSNVSGEVQLQGASTASPHYREWVDNTGKHRTEALLIEVTREFVLLEKPNGSRSKVPLRRLSQADRTYAAKWEAPSSAGQ